MALGFEKHNTHELQHVERKPEVNKPCSTVKENHNAVWLHLLRKHDALPFWNLPELNVMKPPRNLPLPLRCFQAHGLLRWGKADHPYQDGSCILLKCGWCKDRKTQGLIWPFYTVCPCAGLDCWSFMWYWVAAGSYFHLYWVFWCSLTPGPGQPCQPLTWLMRCQANIFQPCYIIYIYILLYSNMTSKTDSERSVQLVSCLFHGNCIH